MSSRNARTVLYLSMLVVVAAMPAIAQSFRVQCPATTITHTTASSTEPAYTSATAVNGAIKCQQISGGDGYATMGDGTQTYMFSFGPLSGLAKIAAGQPGTDFPNEFNVQYTGSTPLAPGDPATTGPSFSYNGAVGLVPDSDAVANGLCTGTLPGRPCRSPADHGCRSHERQHPRTAHGD